MFSLYPWRSSLHQTGNQCDDEQHQEYDEQNLCDIGCTGSDPAETEYRGNNCDNEKDQSPPKQHMIILSNVPATEPSARATVIVCFVITLQRALGSLP
jgi:hypothetical protein